MKTSIIFREKNEVVNDSMQSTILIENENTTAKNTSENVAFSSQTIEMIHFNKKALSNKDNFENSSSRFHIAANLVTECNKARNHENSKKRT